MPAFAGLAAVPHGAGSPEQDAAAIVDLFYDLQFDRAMAAAHDLETRYPDSPAGPFYLGVAAYEEYLLQDPPSPRTIQQFRDYNGAALKKAGNLTKTSPALGHFYQGAVLGFQARALIAQGHYAMAIPKARHGAAHLKKALELDPSLEDAKLGLGLYYYFLARIPTSAKPFAYMMVGMWGDRERGLSLLTDVSVTGHAARREAQSVLASIYSSEREQQWDEAMALLGPLMALFPHNPRYRIKVVYVLERKGQWETAAKTADPEGTWIDVLDPLMKERAKAVARYRAAESLVFAGHWQESVIALDRLESSPVPPSLADWVALRRGNSLDAQGRRADAAAFYSGVSGRKAHGLAESFLKNPFPAGPRDVMPSRWPLPNIPSD